MRFLAPCIFGILFAWAVASLAASGDTVLLQHDVTLLQGAIIP